MMEYFVCFFSKWNVVYLWLSSDESFLFASFPPRTAKSCSESTSSLSVIALSHSSKPNEKGRKIVYTLKFNRLCLFCCGRTSNGAVLLRYFVYTKLFHELYRDCREEWKKIWINFSIEFMRCGKWFIKGFTVCSNSKGIILFYMPYALFTLNGFEISPSVWCKYVEKARFFHFK